MSTTPDHSALRALAEKATPGPWETYNSDCPAVVSPSTKYGVCTTYGIFQVAAIKENNAAYIAAASPDVVLSLLDEIKELSEESKDMNDDLALHREELIKIHRENKALRNSLHGSVEAIDRWIKEIVYEHGMAPTFAYQAMLKAQSALAKGTE